jgi:hypothetical protein
LPVSGGKQSILTLGGELAERGRGAEGAVPEESSLADYPARPGGAEQKWAGFHREMRVCTHDY